MKHSLKTLGLFLLIACLSSCGVLTKARYGNGWKLNIESGLFTKAGDTDQKKRQIRKHRDSGIRKEISGCRETIFPEHVKSVIGAAVEWPVLAKEKLPALHHRRLRKFLPQRVSEQAPGHYQPQGKQYSDRPLEPTVRIAAYLFYGGMIATFIPFLNLVAGVAMLVGLILAIIGLRRLRMSDYAYRGYGLAMSIIIVFVIEVLLILFFLAILFAILL